MDNNLTDEYKKVRDELQAKMGSIEQIGVRMINGKQDPQMRVRLPLLNDVVHHISREHRLYVLEEWDCSSPLLFDQSIPLQLYIHDIVCKK